MSTSLEDVGLELNEGVVQKVHGELMGAAGELQAAVTRSRLAADELCRPGVAVINAAREYLAAVKNLRAAEWEAARAEGLARETTGWLRPRGVAGAARDGDE